MEEDYETYKALLESTKAIPWKLDWDSKQFTYIGPQIERLLGWPQSSWKSVDDWVSRIHPDEREWVLNFCVEQSLKGLDHEADYKALKSDGDFVWVRDVVHVLRKPDGSPESLIGFMFDITENKKTEEQLLNLQKQLEEYSYQDGLTGVANRRMFDAMLEKEWMNALHAKHPISLVMMDIDYFKQYNDYYGHLQGDEVLRRVAQTLNTAGARSRDFFARFGGEEFALILPETDIDAAMKIAERCRKLIFKEQIPHEKSEVSQILTISMGVVSIVPTVEDKVLDFVQAADELMYEAKKNGRNMIVQSD